MVTALEIVGDVSDQLPVGGPPTGFKYSLLVQPVLPLGWWGRRDDEISERHPPYRPAERLCGHSEFLGDCADLRAAGYQTARVGDEQHIQSRGRAA
ncbi:hypothetical protein [Streptomyces nanshensis]|uniref:hypothetical protein n=1 Tax=Streptomyces nanshensis TaxID=518642 RepID=UPI00114CC93B|nr:hypothetical protein [Streptomyces nanshensis]